MSAQQSTEARAGAGDRVRRERGIADDEAVLDRVRPLQRGDLERQAVSSAGLQETRPVGLLPVAGNTVTFAAQLRSDEAAAALIVAVLTTISTFSILIWSVMLLPS